MSINRTEYKMSLNDLKHCLRIVRDFGGKDRKIVITANSIKLVEHEQTVLNGADNIAEHLDTTVEAYYNEP